MNPFAMLLLMFQEVRVEEFGSLAPMVRHGLPETSPT